MMWIVIATVFAIVVPIVAAACAAGSRYDDEMGAD